MKASLPVLLVLVACAPLSRHVPDPLWSPDLAPPRFAADEAGVDTLASGLVHRWFVRKSVPWAVHVLDVDRRACWAPVAVKGSAGAIGRQKTSEIVRQLDSVTALTTQRRPVLAGGVNADFFLFEPAGIPTGALVQNGRLLAGPGERPVFAFDSAGRPWMGALRVEGRAVSGPEVIRVTAWNRHTRGGVAFFDAAFGPTIDSASGTIRVALAGPRGGEVVGIDTLGRTTPIPVKGSVLEVSRDAPTDLKLRVLLLARTRAYFGVDVRLAPFHPREAVGGFPILVRDSAEVPGLDSAGAVTFAPVRHPRTIVGVGAGGRRLMLITVDGRQPGYSVGMTLRESAQLARDLGATQAINLDGGGSTTLVIPKRNGAGYHYEIVNRPSDEAGERPVGDVLAVVNRCSDPAGT